MNKKRRIARIVLLDLPAVLVHTCIAAFATFDELLLDWSLVCKQMQIHARVERDRRAQVIAAMIDECRRVQHLRPPPDYSIVRAMLAVLQLDSPCVMATYPGDFEGSLALAGMAWKGTRPMRVLYVSHEPAVTRRQLVPLRRMIDERLLDLRTPGSLEQTFTRGMLTITFIEGLDVISKFRFDVMMVDPRSGAAQAALAGFCASKLVLAFGGKHEITWVSRDPCRSWRFACVHRFLEAAAATADEPLSVAAP